MWHKATLNFLPQAKPLELAPLSHFKIRMITSLILAPEQQHALFTKATETKSFSNLEINILEIILIMIIIIFGDVGMSSWRHDINLEFIYSRFNYSSITYYLYFPWGNLISVPHFVLSTSFLMGLEKKLKIYKQVHELICILWIYKHALYMTSIQRSINVNLDLPMFSSTPWTQFHFKTIFILYS